MWDSGVLYSFIPKTQTKNDFGEYLVHFDTMRLLCSTQLQSDNRTSHLIISNLNLSRNRWRNWKTCLKHMNRRPYINPRWQVFFKKCTLNTLFNTIETWVFSEYFIAIYRNTHKITNSNYFCLLEQMIKNSTIPQPSSCGYHRSDRITGLKLPFLI